MKSKNRNIIIISLVAIIILAIFVIKPLINKIESIQKNLRFAEVGIKESLQVKTQKIDIENEYLQYEMYLNEAGSSKRERIGNFLKEIERLSQEADISITNLSPLETEEKEGLDAYGADFKSEGGIEDILFFINKIQESKMLIKLDSFSFSPKNDAASILKLNAKIVMVLPQEYSANIK